MGSRSHRAINLIWATDTLASLGDATMALGITLMAFQYGHSVWRASLVLFSASIPYLVFGLVGGAVADRVDKRKLMIAADVARAFLALSIAILSTLHILGLDTLIVLTASLTIIRTFYFPARKALIPKWTTDQNLGRINLHMNGTASLAGIVGPAFGSLLVIWFHHVSLVLLINVLAFSASALITVYLPSTPLLPAIARPSLIADIGTGLGFVTRSPRLRYLFAAFAIQIIVGSGSLQLGLPQLLPDLALSRNVSFGFCLAIIACSNAAISWAWSRFNRYHAPLMIFVGYIIRGVALGLMGLSVHDGGIPLLMLSLLLLGVAMPLSGPGFTTLLQTQTPPALMAKVMAIRSTAGNISDAISYLFIGQLVAQVTDPHMFFIAGAIATASAVVLAWFWAHRTPRSSSALPL